MFVAPGNQTRVPASVEPGSCGSLNGHNSGYFSGSLLHRALTQALVRNCAGSEGIYTGNTIKT